MARNLIIVESPGKVKSISKYLGKNYKVEASVGHVRDLPKSQLGVDTENDFEPKYITIRGKGDLISNLRKEAQKSDKVFLATDPDREGEAISWHLASILKINDSDECRISFNEITEKAVKEAIKAPRRLDYNLVDAQQARRVLDRIVGYKISPILWRKVRKGLSAGRVQSVSVRIICDREEEIEKFVPKEYWNLDAQLQKTGDKLVFTAKFYGKANVKNGKIELTNKEQVDAILEGLEGADYTVKKVSIGTKKKTPAPPFITSTLQQEASRKLGFSTKKTMSLAQQLYEGIEIKGRGTIGVVTYIRTDSMRVSDSARADAASYIKEKYGSTYLPAKPNLYKNRSASQDAHEAIRPSYVNLTPEEAKGGMGRDVFRLYKLIWDRFIASQMAAAVYDTVAADIEAAGYLFKAKGQKLKFPGFIAVYTEGKDDVEDNNNEQVPQLTENEKLIFKGLVPEQKFTQPPSRYTEASLVKELEEKGIGRPSTYAPTITTILARGYIEREGKLLKPTELGRIVTDLLKEHFDDIVDVEFTAKMENQLDEVEEGKIEWRQVLRNFYPDFLASLETADEKIGHVEIPDEVTDIICEKCGRNMVIKVGRFGKFLACPGFPECRNTKTIAEEAGVDCPKCGGKVLIKKSKKGRKFLGCENYPNCSFTSWDMASNEKCPECGSFLLKKFSGKSYKLKCSNETCAYEKDSSRKSKVRKAEKEQA